MLLFALNCNFWHESYLKIFNFESTKVARCLDGPWQRKRNERREKVNKNDKIKRYTSNIIAQTWWKKLLHKFFSWTLNRLLFLRMSYFKWMHISKKWFSRFFLCSGMKLDFFSQLELNNNDLYPFWTEIIDLFAGLVGFKMRANNKFFHSVWQVTRKFCPYVRNM